MGNTAGVVVVDENGEENRPDQHLNPWDIFVDRYHSVYVSAWANRRVMKWEEGAKEGIVVAGGRGEGNSLLQLSNPLGVVVHQLSTTYRVVHKSRNREKKLNISITARPNGFIFLPRIEACSHFRSIQTRLMGTFAKYHC